MSARRDLRGASALIGRSAPINNLRRKIQSLANALIPVVISGESGTGKELVARCLHAQANPQGPFVVVDCSAVSKARVDDVAFAGRTCEDSDFFGLKLREAEGGALPEHVERLTCYAQAKLAWSIEHDGTCRVDDPQSGTRIMASTREDLLSLCDRGVFLPDLFYALSVVHLESVPLREAGRYSRIA